MNRRPRIVVADDDPALLGAVARALTLWGAEVSTAVSGADLIAQLADHGPFDLVVTDISMPWMSGVQAMHAARYAGLATPVVVMTGLRDERIDAQVASLGRRVVLLRKPFELDALEAAVASLLGPAQVASGSG